MPAAKITPPVLRVGSTGHALLQQARRYAAVDATVLITGD